MAIVKLQTAVQGARPPKTVPGIKKLPGAAAPPPAAPRIAAALYGLPTQRSVPPRHFSAYTWFIYGPKGIGKSTLAAEMDSGGGQVLFIMFEPGGTSMRVFQPPVLVDWSQAKHLIGLLEQDKQGYTTVVFDPGNLAYNRCLEWVSRARGIPHPGMMKDYGASWAAVNTEFQMIHSRIAALGMTFVVIAHDKEAEIERRDGTKYSTIVPVMSPSTAEFYSGVIDIVAHYEYIGTERYLRIRGGDDLMATCKLDENFLTPSGERVFRISGGGSAKEAYANIKLAFDNQQAQTYRIM